MAGKAGRPEKEGREDGARWAQFLSKVFLLEWIPNVNLTWCSAYFIFLLSSVQLRACCYRPELPLGPSHATSASRR